MASGFKLCESIGFRLQAPGFRVQVRRVFPEARSQKPDQPTPRLRRSAEARYDGQAKAEARRFLHTLFRRTVLCTAVWLTATAPIVRANPESATLRARGFELAYNLDHDAALALFRQAIAADPSDPAGYRALAAVTWLNLVFRRGAITFDAYASSVAKPNVAVKEPPPAQAALFVENIHRALALAEQRVQANLKDPEAHYQVGATIGLLASYTAVIDGKPLKAFRSALRAYDEHETVLKLDAQRQDAALIVGTYRYIVSAQSLPARWMAYAAGFGGGREQGIRLMEAAAAFPSDVQTNARFGLILIYNREKRYDRALDVIATLQRLYPRNRLLWLEAGSTALRAGQAARADAYLTEGIARLAHDTRPRAFGEEALWMYKRGATRVLLRRPDEAMKDLQAALAGEASDWVRARAEMETGKLADLAGDRARAEAAYGRAARLCETDSDHSCVAEAKALIRRAYR